MRFYPNSNTGCLNWVKRPHGDSLGDAAQPGVRASRALHGGDPEPVRVKSVLAGSESSSPPFVYLFRPGVKYGLGYTVVKLTPLNQFKSLVNCKQ